MFQILLKYTGIQGVVHMKEKPCCAAEAPRRIRPVDVGGMTIGIAMLDLILTDVKGMKISGKKEIGDELLKRVKVYNYCSCIGRIEVQGSPAVGIPGFTGMKGVM